MRYNGIGWMKSFTENSTTYWNTHDHQGRTLMTRRETDVDGSSDPAFKQRNVYHNAGRAGSGSSSYRNGIVLRDSDRNNDWDAASDGTLEARHYYAQNHRGDVVATVTDAGELVDQIRYDGYGYPTALPSGDTNSDGAFDAKDVITGTYNNRNDVNLDGSNNIFDLLDAFNRLGQLRSVIDQNGTQHDLHRDDLGRVASDVAAVIGSGSNISGWARRIDVSYDDLGRLSDVETYDATTSGTVLNAMQFTYSPLWQIDKMFQDHDGAVTLSSGSPTGNTREVGYTYTNAEPAFTNTASNYSRVTSMSFLYDDAEQAFHYGASGSMDDRIHRLQQMKMDGTSFVEYNFLGLGKYVEVDYPSVDVQLDRTFDHDGSRRTQGLTTGTIGEYPGFDRFGRVVRHAWVDGGLTTGTGSLPDVPPIFEETYTYDRGSRRLSRSDARPGATWADRDFAYEYDDLNRLETAYRGYDLLETTKVYSSSGSKQWALDMLGNWKTFATDTDGDGDFDGSDTSEERDYNEANELISLDPDGTGGTADKDLVYDKVGNVRSSEVKGFVYTHDAWNRLVAVETDDTTPIELGEYEYYGLNWRSMKRSDTDAIPDGLDEEREFIYNASWQIVEERVDEDYVSSPGEDETVQLHWGTRYIDDLAMRRHMRSDSETETFTRYHVLTDVQSSVRVVLESDGDVLERVNYSPYGVGEHHPGSDVDGDHAASIIDVIEIATVSGASPAPTIGSSTYKVECDLDRDGDVDFSDYSNKYVTQAKITDGWISVDGLNEIGYAGYVFNPEADAYLSRFRWYDPQLGRWLERDPLGFVDGMNRYGYVMGDPVLFVDPPGLQSTGPDEECECPNPDSL